MKIFFVEAQLTHATRTPDLGYPEFFALMTSAGAVAPHPDLGSWHIQVEDDFDHLAFKTALTDTVKHGDVVLVHEFHSIEMPKSTRP